MNGVVFVKFPAKYSWLWLLHHPFALQNYMSLHCSVVLCYVSTHIKATVHCLLVQDRMEAASTSVNMFDGVVRGQHVCKNVWTPLTDKMCKCIVHEGSSKRDKSAVNIQL